MTNLVLFDLREAKLNGSRLKVVCPEVSRLPWYRCISVGWGIPLCPFCYSPS